MQRERVKEMLLNVREYPVDTGDFRTNCIQFGQGERKMILISGLNIKDARGKAAAHGLAHSYRLFARDYTVYLFDRRENLPEHFSVEQIAADIAACMDKLEIVRADVIGVSQGGMIAQYLAINRPDLVSSLVLCVTASRSNALAEENIRRWMDMARENGLRSILTDYFSRIYSEEYFNRNAALLPVLTRTVHTMPLDRFLTLAEACLTVDTYDRLSEIRCPVLVMGGERDQVVSPEASYDIAERLNCPIIMYEQFGHSAYEEAEDFNMNILNFLNETRKTAVATHG